MSDWISTLISVAVGGVIGFVSSLGLEFWRNKKTEAKVRDSLLGEIGANAEAAEKGDLSSLLWVDDVYKSNLDKLGYFPQDRLQKIVCFYAKVAQYRDRITRGYEQYLKEREKANQAGVQAEFDSYWGTVEMLAKEIKTIAEEILENK